MLLAIVKYLMPRSNVLMKSVPGSENLGMLRYAIESFLIFGSALNCRQSIRQTVTFIQMVKEKNCQISLMNWD